MAGPRAQEEHSYRIKGYKKTFRRLAKEWLAARELTDGDFAEIVASVNANSWTILRPVLYVIPRGGIADKRIIKVPRSDRGAYGPEFKIVDLKSDEFDMVDLSLLVR